MTVVAYTFYGEKITICNTTKEKALEVLAKGGVNEDDLFRLEVKK